MIISIHNETTLIWCHNSSPGYNPLLFFTLLWHERQYLCITVLCVSLLLNQSHFLLSIILSIFLPCLSLSFLPLSLEHWMTLCFFNRSPFLSPPPSRAALTHDSSFLLFSSDCHVLLCIPVDEPLDPSCIMYECPFVGRGADAVV